MRKDISMYKNILIGVEIELEVDESIQESPCNVNLTPNVLENWSVLKDGSLRNGVEYIFNEPKLAKDSYKCLKDLEEFVYKSFGEEALLFTDRTSVHVHVDFRAYSPLEIKVFFIKYLVFEEMLYLLVDERRRKNNYCKAISNSEGLRGLCTENYSLFFSKYTSANHTPYGSIEFRIHHGEISADVITKWIITLLTMREIIFKTTYNELIALVDSGEEFVDKVLGNDYPDVDRKAAYRCLVSGVESMKMILEKERLLSEAAKTPKGTLIKFKEIAKFSI